MFRNVCVHRVDKADVIHHLGGLRENVANPFASLAVLFESKRRLEQPAFGVSQRLEVDFLGALALARGNLRFVIKRVDGRRTTRHKELNDAIRPRRKMRLPGNER